MRWFSNLFVVIFLFVGAAIAQNLGPPGSGSGTVTSVGCFGTSITTSGTCTTAASKSDQQVGSSNTLVVTPAQQQSHDSAAKAWAVFSTGASPVIGAGYNVSSITHVGTGDYTINFTTAFASTNYVCVVTPDGGVSSTFGIVVGATKATSSVQVGFVTTSSTFADPTNGQVACYGRQ